MSDLIIAWAHGWALSRGRPTPVAVPGGVRIDPGRAAQATRFVLASGDGPTLTRLGHHLTAEGTEIKVAGTAAALRAALGPTWQMYRLCSVMTTPFTAGTVTVRHPYRTQVVAGDGVLLGLILDAGGGIAASGRLAPYGRFGSSIRS